MIFLSFKKLLVIILLKNTQSYVSYLAKFWPFSILANGQFFSFFIKFWRTCDTGINVFCEMAKKAPKLNGIFLILPFVRNPSTSEREHVTRCARTRISLLRPRYYLVVVWLLPIVSSSPWRLECTYCRCVLLLG